MQSVTVLHASNADIQVTVQPHDFAGQIRVSVHRASCAGQHWQPLRPSSARPTVLCSTGTPAPAHLLLRGFRAEARIKLKLPLPRAGDVVHTQQPLQWHQYAAAAWAALGARAGGLLLRGPHTAHHTDVTPKHLQSQNKQARHPHTHSTNIVSAVLPMQQPLTLPHRVNSRVHAPPEVDCCSSNSSTAEIICHWPTRNRLQV